ncbi:MAG TPA: hypothetical protein VD735_06010 [Candidatus Saccharimonadales bacterium]|nr:hypothetical protein [Candidatus Saccharimonadales bacterium]
MQSVTLYHEAAAESLPDLLHNGLTYGTQGTHSQDGIIQQVNSFLDGCRPTMLAKLHVSRVNSLYAYYGAADKILDVRTGALIPIADWRVQPGMAKVSLAVDPEYAFLGNLNTYDQIAAAFAKGKAEHAVVALAHTYWQEIVPVTQVLSSYDVQSDGLYKKQNAPAGLPARLPRMEVLITANVPAQNITKL